MSEGLAALLAAPFVGSFVATLALRLPDGEPVVFARSHCRSCGRTLGARDLVPVLSWLSTRGRCRRCGAALGWFYPVVELGALALAAAAVAADPPGGPLLAAGLGWALLALALCDLRRFILPDVLTLPLIAAGLVVAWRLAPGGGAGGVLAAHAAGAAGGYAAFVLIARLYRRIRGREGLGDGDAKLMAAAGAWLGWPPLPLLVATAAALALAAALVSRRPFDPLRRIPLGAPLAAVFFVFWILQ